MLRTVPDPFRRVEYLLTTGNLNSPTGLGLQQVRQSRRRSTRPTPARPTASLLLRTS